MLTRAQRGAAPLSKILIEYETIDRDQFLRLLAGEAEESVFAPADDATTPPAAPADEERRREQKPAAAVCCRCRPSRAPRPAAPDRPAGRRDVRTAACGEIALHAATSLPPRTIPSVVAEEGEREQERRLDDERDARWLATGDHARLLAAYFDLVRNLARVRARSDDEADEVTQAVMCKLMGELRGGKVYTAPFRAVVIQRTKWVQHDLWRRRKPGARGALRP